MTPAALALPAAKAGVSNDAPSTLAIQPEPVKTIVARHRTPSGDWTTSVFRAWEPGHSALCRLCPRGACCAKDDACLVAVDGLVPQGRAKMLDTHGYEPAPRWEGGGV